MKNRAFVNDGTLNLADYRRNLPLKALKREPRMEIESGLVL
jgi:hypothetical protein